MDTQTWFSTEVVPSTLARGPMPRAHVRLPGRVSLSIVSAHRTQMFTEHVLFISV